MNASEKRTSTISVIIPCYNSAALLIDQLSALVGQRGVRDFEVVVADNGSTDNLKATCEQFGEKLQIRCIDASRRRGAAYARNIGAVAARGDILLFCDADDVVTPEWVKYMSEPLMARDCVVSGSLLGWDGQSIPAGQELHDLEAADVTPYMKGKIPFAPSGNCGYRRDTYLRLGGMELGFHGGCEDVDLAWRAQESGLELVFVREGLVYYRQRQSVKSMMIQHYRFTREDVRLWKLAQLRGHETYIVSLRGAVERIASLPSLLIKSRKDPVNLATVACIGGSLAGHAKYRVFRKPGGPVMEALSRSEIDHGIPSQVVFLVNSMCAPNGVVSSVESLADEFLRRDIPVSILNIGESDAEFKKRFSLTSLRPLVRFTTDMPEFDKSRKSLRLLRHIFSLAIFPMERWLVRSRVNEIDSQALVIAAGMECLEYVQARCPVPGYVVGQVHLSLSGLDASQWARLRRCVQLSQAMTVFDEVDAAEMDRLGLGPALVIPNICPVEPLTEIPAKEKVVVFVGRLAEEKQVPLLVEAFEQAGVPGWKLKIYGRGPEEAIVRARVNASSADVTMEGFTDDAVSVLANASIHALTSRAEGLPMSILEAAAVGTPTVAFECAPGVAVAVGKHGVVTAMGDTSSFARELRRLMTDPLLLAERQRLCLQDRRFSGDLVGDKWIAAWGRWKSDMNSWME